MRILGRKWQDVDLHLRLTKKTQIRGDTMYIYIYMYIQVYIYIYFVFHYKPVYIHSFPSTGLLCFI